MSFSNPIDVATPEGTESIGNGDDRIREFKDGVQELLSVDHEASLTETSIDSVDSGCHNKITLLEQGSDPSAQTGVDTNFGLLYTKKDTGGTDRSELFWKDESDNVLMLTSASRIDITTNFLLNNNYITAQTVGDTTTEIIKIGTDDSVTIATWVGREAHLSSAFLPQDDKDIACKLYVDNQVATKQDPLATDPAVGIMGQPVKKDTNNDTFLMNHFYQAQCDGFVFVDYQGNADYTIYLYESNKTTLIYSSTVNQHGSGHIQIAVPKNKVFKTQEAGGEGPLTIMVWTPIGTGGMVDLGT
jgi:hypothetical protein